jgi:UMF1 family MFS transporter
VSEIPAHVPYSRGEQRAWFVYDWANSAFASTVVTLFLGPYLTALAKAAADQNGLIYPLGIAVDARSYWSYLIALSVFSQVVCLPVLGAIADYGSRKKELLGLFAYTGSGATILLYFVEGANYLLGGVLFLIANLAFGASIVMYNAFLPEISPPEERDAVSSKGWGIGYLGGGLLLALNLALYTKAGELGLEESLAVRISLGSAGVWWALFSIFPLARLRRRRPTRHLPAGQGVLAVGFRQLWRTLRELRNFPMTLTFLVAFLVYNDAIQAVITLSGQYGSDYLKIPMSALTLAILMVQFVAFAGALLFTQLARWMTAKGAVLLSLVLWTLLMVAMYAVKTTAHFFIAAALVGLIMGGSQALSRSLFSLMIPKGKEAEYFSLYEISDKGTSWLAPLIFGLTLQFTGSYQLAILSLIVFFAGGLALLARVDVARATEEAAHPRGH